VIGIWWMRSMNDTQKRAELETHWNRPLPGLVSQWAMTTAYILGLAKEAYQLQQDLL